MQQGIVRAFERPYRDPPLHRALCSGILAQACTSTHIADRLRMPIDLCIVPWSYEDFLALNYLLLASQEHRAWEGFQALLGLARAAMGVN